MKAQPSITESEFLKEDFMTSSRFKKDPEQHAMCNQVRFKDLGYGRTVNRSHLGTSDYFAAYEKMIKDEKEKKKREQIRAFKKL